SVGRDFDLADRQNFLTDLRTAVEDLLIVPPPADHIRIAIRKQVARHRHGEGDQEAALPRFDRLHLEGDFAIRPQALQAELVALVIPVAVRADAAHIEASIRTPHEAVDARFDALGEAEDASLIIAADILDKHPLDAAV